MYIIRSSTFIKEVQTTNRKLKRTPPKKTETFKNFNINSQNFKLK